MLFSIVRSHFLKMRKWAIWIQKMWRGYQCRRDFTAVRTSALPSQSSQSQLRPLNCCFLSACSHPLSDEGGLLPPPGPGALQEDVRLLPRCAPADHLVSRSLPRLPGAPRLPTPTVGLGDHPGLRPRFDRSPALQEAARRGSCTSFPSKST